MHKAVVPFHNNLLGFILAYGVLLGSFAGCGYTLVGAAPNATTTRITLAVTPFANRTREPNLESHMQDALRRAIVQSRVFKLTSVVKAPRLLHGTIRRFHIVPLSFDANDNALQYRIEADVAIRLVDKPAQATRLERQISAWAEYLVSSTGEVRENVVAREAALVRLAEQFASKCTALLMITLL